MRLRRPCDTGRPVPLTRPTVNHRADGLLPVGTRRLRFGWTLIGTEPVSTVRVVLSSRPDTARGGRADVWDSGRRTVDRPDFSDVCLAAELGTGPGAIPLPTEETVWWSVQLGGPSWPAGPHDWSEPVPLRQCERPILSDPPRPLATVTGSLSTVSPRPDGEESLFRWLSTQGAAAVWPLLGSLDVSARVAGWLDRLRAQLHPADPASAELYIGLVQAADLCYDDPQLRAEHPPTVLARQRLRRSAPALVRAVPVTLGAGAVTDVLGVALPDLFLPLLGTVDATAPAAPLPVGVVVREVAGIRPTAPGYRRFRVEPCLLPQATAVDVSLQTPRGAVLVRLRRHPDTLAQAQVTLDVPVGAIATLALPWSGEEITLDPGSYVFVND